MKNDPNGHAPPADDPAALKVSRRKFPATNATGLAPAAATSAAVPAQDGKGAARVAFRSVFRNPHSAIVKPEV